MSLQEPVTVEICISSLGARIRHQAGIGRSELPSTLPTLGATIWLTRLTLQVKCITWILEVIFAVCIFAITVFYVPLLPKPLIQVRKNHERIAVFYRLALCQAPFFEQKANDRAESIGWHFG